MAPASSSRRRDAIGQAIGTCIAAAFVVGTLGSTLSLLHQRPWNWGAAAAAIYPLMGGILGPLFARLLRRWDLVPIRPHVPPRPADDDEARRVLRTGALPAGADVEAWRPRIRGQIRFVLLVGLGIGGGLLCVAVLTGITAHLTSHDDAGVWALAAVLGVLGAAMLVLARSRFHAGRRLLDRLSLREAEPG